MNEACVRKDLEKVFEGFTPQDIDERKIIIPEQSVVREVLEKYAELLEIPGFYWTDSNTAPNTPDGDLNPPIDAMSYILTPDEIRLFYQCAEIFEDHRKSSYLLVPFLNQLLSNSHFAGYNNFFLDTAHYHNYQRDTGEYQLKSTLFSHINGWGNIIGYNHLGSCLRNTGCYRENAGSYLHISLNGRLRVDRIADSAVHLSISFLDDCVYNLWVGFQAMDCIFTFHGDLGLIDPSRSEHMMLYAATRCQFKTTQESTLQTLLKRIDPESDHKIYFIHPDGHEELTRGD